MVPKKTWDQVYNISFADNIMAHVVFDSGYVYNSQIYQLLKIEKKMIGKVSNFTFTALSGISGSKYYYELNITEDGRLQSLKRTQESGEVSVFTGDISELRTFKQ